MLNQVAISGRLTADPELRHTTNGTACCTFTLAVERDRRDKTTGSRPADFIDCVAWRYTAEFVSKYFTKGSPATVTGRIQTRTWTDRNESNRKSTELMAENVYFAGAKRGEESQLPERDEEYFSQVPPENEFAELEDDGALPF